VAEPDGLARLEEAAAQVLGGFSAGAALDQRAESAAAVLLGLDQPSAAAPRASSGSHRVPGRADGGTTGACRVACSLLCQR
jgi:hypothetical protein